MNKSFACFFIFFSAVTVWADSSITASNSWTLVAGQAVLPTPTNYNVYWPTFSYDFLVNTKVPGPPPQYWGPGGPPTFPPGYGFFMYKKKDPVTLTLPDPTSVVLPLQLPAGWSIICCQSNVPATFDMIVGRPPTEGTLIYRLLTNYAVFPTPALANDTNYTVYKFSNDSWSPEPPIAGVGEAIWVFQPPVISILQVTNGTITFGALTGWGTSTAVEWTDSLTDSWQTLTNFSYASGNVTNVVDSVATEAPTQRFYRLNMAETTQ